jgi:hypothetical protein
MATTPEAAAIITRRADPQGDHFGVAADVSYSFFGGPFAFTQAQQTAAENAQRLWSDVAQINFFVDNADPEIGYKNYSNPSKPTSTGRTSDEDFDYNSNETHDLGFNLAWTGGVAGAVPGAQATQLGQGQLGHNIPATTMAQTSLAILSTRRTRSSIP